MQKSSIDHHVILDRHRDVARLGRSRDSWKTVLITTKTSIELLDMSRQDFSREVRNELLSVWK